jgi:hypothetical protein
MTSTVEKDNLVVVPRELAAELAIGPGTVLSWERGVKPGVLTVTVLKDRAEMAASLLGAGRKYLSSGKSGQAVIDDLIRERELEDRERQASL